jgi:hypothetical protein
MQESSIPKTAKPEYEIKSDRDRLDRLRSQISTYLQAFAHVNVVTSDRHLERVFELVPPDVGVLRLTARGHLSSIRDPVEDVTRIVPTKLFGALRIQEAKAIVRRLGLSVPDVPNTRMHRALRAIFDTLDAPEVHAAMVETLRKSRSQKALAGLLEAVPPSLHAATLTTRLRKADHPKLCAALDTPMEEALRWI